MRIKINNISCRVKFTGFNNGWQFELIRPSKKFLKNINEGDIFLDNVMIERSLISFQENRIILIIGSIKDENDSIKDENGFIIPHNIDPHNIDVSFNSMVMAGEKCGPVKGGETETKYHISKEPVMITIKGTIFADGVAVAVINGFELVNKPLVNIILNHINLKNIIIEKAYYNSLDNSINISWREPPAIESYCNISYEYSAQ